MVDAFELDNHPAHHFHQGSMDLSGYGDMHGLHANILKIGHSPDTRKKWRKPMQNRLLRRDGLSKGKKKQFVE
jgi:hypothetical protein